MGRTWLCKCLGREETEEDMPQAEAAGETTEEAAEESGVTPPADPVEAVEEADANPVPEAGDTVGDA